MWSNKYIGIPYKDYGRDETGIDCWGLVCLVYKQEFNIELPTFDSSYHVDDRKQLHQLIAQHRESWVQLDAPKPGCVVLFKILGSESHVGIAISPTQFLHARDGYDTSVESFDNTNWRSRIVGYFEYQQATDQVPVVALPHPLQTKRVMLGVDYGSTIQQVLDRVDVLSDVSPELKKRVVVMLNSRVVPESEYATTVVKHGDTLEYRALPGKEVGRLILTLAVVYLAVTYGAALGGALGFTTTTTTAAGLAVTTTTAAGVAIGQALIITAGTLLVNAIMPIRPPTGPGDPGTGESPKLISGAGNRVNRYGSIPFVLGKMRVTPPLGAQNYVRYGAGTETETGALDNATKAYLDMLLVWGYGPLQIDETTLKIGEVSLWDYNVTPRKANYEGLDYVTLDRQPGETQNDIDRFNQIYGIDREQKSVGVELTCAGLPPSRGEWTPATTPGPWIETGFSSPSDRIAVALHFPQGLRAINVREGTNHPAPVRIRLEYKTPTSDWQLWTTQTIGGTATETSTTTSTVIGYDENGTPIYEGSTTNPGTITGGAARKDGFTWVVSLNRAQRIFADRWGVNDTLVIRARRETGDETEPSSDWRYQHTVIFSDATSTLNQHPAVDPKNVVIAKTALTIQATDQLNNQIEGINAVVQTWCLDWDGTAWTPRATSNPASLFRYVLQSGANPQRILDSEVPVKLDLAKLQYWHEYCNQLRTDPETGSTYKYEFNSVVGQQRSVLEVLRDICAAGKASPALQDGRWTVIIDEPKPTVVQHFSPHNSWGFEGTKSLPRLPDALKVNFFDESQGYQDAELIIPFAGKTFAECSLFESITLPGVTNKYLAKDHARWHIAQAQLRPEVYTLNTDVEYLVCNRGDRVKVSHDVPMWGLGSGRVKNRITANIFDLDEAVPVDNIGSYTIRVRSKTGASTATNLVTGFNILTATRSANRVTLKFANHHPLQVGDRVGVLASSLPQLSQSTAEIIKTTDTTITYSLTGSSFVETSVTGVVSLQDGYYSRIQTTDSATAAQIDAEDLFLYGENQQESQDLIIISIEPIGNKSARITLADYGVTDTYNIFTDYLTLSASEVFESQITLPPNLLINSFEDKKPEITSIVSDETVMELIAPGVFKYNMSVGYTNVGDLPDSTELVEAQVDYASATDTIGVRTVRVAFSGGNIRIADVDEGSEYKIRLRYVGRDGRTGSWTEYVNHTIVGKSNPPSSVTNFTASVDENGGKILLTWDANPEIDLQGYEVRVANSDWGTDIGLLYRGPNTRVELNPQLLLSDNTWHIKAFDTSGNYSLEDVSVVISTPTPLSIDPLTLQVNFGGSSATSSTVTLSWSKAAVSGFAIAGYRISYGTKTVFANSTSITVEADWLGELTFSVVTVDILGTESAPVTKTIIKLPPSTPSNFTNSVNKSSGKILFTWTPNPEQDLKGYELRLLDENWGSNGEYLYKGTDSLAEVSPQLLVNNAQVYIRAYDFKNNYSVASASTTFNYPTPTQVDVASIQAIFADTSLTAATVTFSWKKVDDTGFAIAGYRITFGTVEVFVNANTLTLQADWVGDKVFSIVAIDIIGTESLVSSKVITKLPPAPVPESSYRIQVIDNNVLLYWTLPERTTLPVSHVVIRKSKKTEGVQEYSWDTAENIGEKTGTFTSFSELASGEYIYWIRTVDTDGVESSDTAKIAVVAQPPDFIFNGVLISAFNGTKVNAFKTNSSLLLFVNTSETWQQHFTANNWNTPQNQVNAGYPVYIQPGVVSAEYTEVFDYGTVLASSQITLEVLGSSVVGSSSVVYTISYSLDGIIYSTPQVTNSLFASNFRYVKVYVTGTQITSGAIYQISSMDVRLDSKKITDSGKQLILSSGGTGTIINFNKIFVDVDSIQLTPAGTTPVTAVYDFADSVIPGTFVANAGTCTITTNIVDGHGLLPGQNIRATFSQGTIPIDVYTIIAVPSSNTLTFNIPLGVSISGNMSFYPNSMLVYTFDRFGAEVSAQVSWAISGF